MRLFSGIRKSIAVTALAALVWLPAITAQAKEPFSDISKHWAKKEMVRLYSQSLINGYQGKFLPEQNVTRAQLATMLVNALGLSDQAITLSGVQPLFKDVPASHWAAGAILVAKENGLISGYENNTFRPDYPVRRDEMGAMLVRALKIYKDSGPRETLPFNDRNAIPDWAVGELVIAKKLGLISGYEDGTFRPAKHTSRAEAAVLINRILAEQGRAYDFAGTIVNLIMAPLAITLDVQGQKLTFSIVNELLVYEGLTPVALDRLQAGDKVCINVNSEGKLTYLEKNISLDIFPWIGGALNTKSIKGSRELSTLKVPEALPTGALKYQAVEKLSSQGNLLAEAEFDPLARPEKSLEVTKKEMEASEFTRQTGSDGKGQIIAIIDTGVDPGHQDLMRTTDGKPKVVDWVDFTTEGIINTNPIEAINGLLPLASGNYKVSSIKSKSGNYRYGFFHEETSSAKIDVNLNGSTSDSFSVILVDQEVAGIYDTVYVDANGDKSFNNEKPLKLYRDSFEVGSFPEVNDRHFNFVISKIDPSGASLQLSFDGNDHGTHVAGIAAANGLLQGVAPGAQIMALKALDSNGYGDEASLIEAINYAAINGAKVINLSIGFPTEKKDGKSSLAQLVNRLTKEYGVSFVVASGNDGPGLTTLATPGDASGAITVGAFISPEMWERDFGWEVSEASLWFFSSIGPRRDGGFMPTLLAPGSVVSTVPTWEAKGYYFSEGTSMAAPHVAGAIALLNEKAQRSGLKVTPDVIKRALEMGARPLPDFSPAEQGYGVINLTAAWTHLQKLKPLSSFSNVIYNRDLDLGEGLYARGFLPGEMDFYLRSGLSKASIVNLQSTQSWLRPLYSSLVLPVNKLRLARVKYQLPEEPGIYSALLRVDDPATYGPDLEILNTVIKPIELNEKNNYTQSFDKELGAGRYQRYFFEVPEGTDSLSTTLEFVYEDGTYPGRARIHLYNPQGKEIDKDLLDFAGIDERKPKAKVSKEVSHPEPGVWEVIIYSSATLSEYGLQNSSYKFEVGLGQVVQEEPSTEEARLFFGLLPRKLVYGQNSYVTLQIRDTVNKRPYQGVLEVNGLLYSVRQGRLVLPIKPMGIDYPVVVKTIVDNTNKQKLEYRLNIPVTQ